MTKKVLFAVLMVLALVVSAVSAADQPSTFNLISVQLPDGSWLDCAPGAEFPFGMKYSSDPETPWSFQEPCNQVWQAKKVLGYVYDGLTRGEGVVLYDSNQTIMVNPYMMEFQFQ